MSPTQQLCKEIASGKWACVTDALKQAAASALKGKHYPPDS